MTKLSLEQRFDEAAASFSFEPAGQQNFEKIRRRQQTKRTGVGLSAIAAMCLLVGVFALPLGGQQQTVVGDSGSSFFAPKVVPVGVEFRSASFVAPETELTPDRVHNSYAIYQDSGGERIDVITTARDPDDEPALGVRTTQHGYPLQIRQEEGVWEFTVAANDAWVYITASEAFDEETLIRLTDTLTPAPEWGPTGYKFTGKLGVLTIVDGSALSDTMPAGFHELHYGNPAAIGENDQSVFVMFTKTTDFGRLTLSPLFDQVGTADVHGEVVPINGSGLDGQNPLSVAWLADDGATTIQVRTYGLSQSDLLAVARSVEEIDQEQWDELTNTP